MIRRRGTAAAPDRLAVCRQARPTPPLSGWICAGSGRAPKVRARPGSCIPIHTQNAPPAQFIAVLSRFRFFVILDAGSSFQLYTNRAHLQEPKCDFFEGVSQIFPRPGLLAGFTDGKLQKNVIYCEDDGRTGPSHAEGALPPASQKAAPSEKRGHAGGKTPAIPAQSPALRQARASGQGRFDRLIQQ